jgi:hypothetical protein
MSPRFYSILRESHTPFIRAEVTYNGAIVVPDLQVTGGSVTMQADDLSRSSLSGLTYIDRNRTLLPDTPNSVLGVYGHEINIYRGVRFSGSDYSPDVIEEALVGKFRVQSLNAEEIWSRPDGEAYHSPAEWLYVGSLVSADGQDRAANIIDARFINAEQPLSGNSVQDEIIRICDDIIEVDTSNWYTLPDKTPPSSIAYQEDRGDALADLAQAIDCRVFVTRDGLLRLEPIGELPNSLLGTERPIPAVQSISTTTTRDGIYNAVVARGEEIDNAYPVQGFHPDDDPSGRTTWGGPFGRVPYFYASPILGTPQAAELAAETRMKNLIKGRERKFTLTGVPDPTLDPNDYVRVVLPGREPFPGKIESITLPLDETSLMTLEIVASEATVLEAVLPGS